MAAPKALIITGNGFNCEKETAFAFEGAGAESEQVHMNDIVKNKSLLKKFQIMAFVGGFSYGDHLGAGKVAANKFNNYLADELLEFIHRDTLVAGICNGFQVIAQLGLVPGFDDDYRKHVITVAENNSKRYEDRWVYLKGNKSSQCVFTKNIDQIFVPVRHGEGRVYSPDKAVYYKLIKNNQIALQYIDPATSEPTEKYPHNPNGSPLGIAGICDPTGRIFGLMPHPEAHLSPYNNPFWTRLKVEGKLPEEGDGASLFRNAVEYFN